ncbi:MAG: DUF3570 domain-containing protein [Rubrivivax sp.]|nr:DUF3570 domain-containing protein [Rubrivivax sp.]
MRAKKARRAATASVGVVVAAIEAAGEAASRRGAAAGPEAHATPAVPRPPARDLGRPVGSVVAAAMLLPGVFQAARAEGKPDAASVSLHVLGYQDSQPGLKRISVYSPQFNVVAPLGDEDWWLNGTLVYDAVSGASPRYHTAISGASRMSDRRTAADVSVTRYFRRASVALGLAGSTERDYKSLAGSLDLRWASEDQNTELSLGIGGSGDSINPVNQVVVDEARSTQQVSIGVTQVASRTDVLQLTLSHGDGKGYYSDPYKTLDRRPRERRQSVLMLRWNHHFADGGSTLRNSWRAYLDSFGVQSHTLQLEWVVPLGDTLKISPLLRLYTQTAADFYADAVYDPVLGEPFPVGYSNASPPRFITLDQRLSAFGAVAAGLGFAWALDSAWTLDGKLEAYEQRGNWAWDGNGSKGLAPFRAYQVQLGVTRRFR